MVENREDLNNPTSETSKVRRLFRNPGRTATEATVKQVVIAEPLIDNEVESNPIPFDLEEKLANYQQLWEEHQYCIEDSLSDSQLRDDTSTVINTYLTSRPNATPAIKAGLARLSNGGFDKIVKISFGAGRLYSTRRDRIDLNAGESFLKTVNSLVPQAKEWERVKKKLLYLFDPAHLGVAPLLAPKVHARLVDIYDMAKKTYEPIYKLEGEMHYAIMRELQKNPNSAIKLLDSFQECSDSEIGIEKTFARFLANSYELYGNSSELGQALGSIEKLEATNTFTNDFLKKQLAQNNGDNLIAFFAAKNWSSETEFLRFMEKAFEDWPEDYKQTYKSYLNEKLGKYSTDIHRQVQSTKHKAWMMTDLNSVEIEVDRIWEILYPGQLKPDDKANLKRQNGRVAQKNKLSVEDIAADVHFDSVEQQPLRQVIGVRRDIKTNQFNTQPGESIEDMVSRYLGHDPQAKRLTPIYMQAIESLKVTPFPSKGVASTAKSTQSSHIPIDGKRTKIYRANPVQIPGIKAPTELQRGRIIYAVNRDNLIIVNMFATHDEYEKFYKSL